MRSAFNFPVEPFTAYSEYTFEDGELDSEVAVEAELSRSSPAYIAWVQHTLNLIMGLKLAVDGSKGTATTNAIRNFQQQARLTVDGKLGPQTEQQLVQGLQRIFVANPQAVCTGIRQPEVLDQFDFDSDKIKPAIHGSPIFKIAGCVVASQQSAQPIRTIRLVGHTDPVGSSTYNNELGRRRAARVQQILQEIINLLSPGLAGRLTITVETRGEAQPISNTAAQNRRVEVLLAKPPIPPKGCPPFKARVRLHFKILHKPDVSIATMLKNMQQVYAKAGFAVELGSTETLNLPDLVDLDVGGTDGCVTGLVTAEQQQLFSHRNHTGTNEIAVYFVRSTDRVLNGCAAHPPGRPSAVVTQIASQWTLAHEVGHVLGLNHVSSEACATTGFTPTRLMTGCGTGRLTGTPTLIQSEIVTMDASALTVNC